MLRLEDTPRAPVTVDPIIVQTKANVFLNPFAGPEGKGSAPAGLLLYDGLALPRGVLAWHVIGPDPARSLRMLAEEVGPDVFP